MEVVGGSMQASTIFLIIALTASQYVFQSSFEAIWGLINSFQLVFYLPLMGILIPPNVLSLLEFLAFFNGDLYVL